MLVPTLLFVALLAGFAGPGQARDENLCFPKSFLFGVATASYQIEGAWNVSGKGESIWDRYTHAHPELVFDGNNGDVADDSYHHIKEDVAMLVALNVNFYRFSISWPRILPDGLSNKINEDGIRYYRELMKELSQHGIAPLVTMYHWDLPQALQDLGGWTNPIMADYFVDYARVLFENFGDQVSTWVTFNEPYSFCHDGYGGWDAPGGRSSGFEDYLCAHHVLIAHGRVYRMYQDEFKDKQKGSIGITLSIPWLEPNTTSRADNMAAERARQFYFGWFANPIFSVGGDYPAVMRRGVDAISHRQGFRRSRLPTFKREQVDLIRGSFDFLGVNHYTTRMVTEGSGRVDPQPSFENDLGVTITYRPDWPKTNSTWLRVVPWGFRKALNWIRTTYNNPLMIVTENGVSMESGLRDHRRVQYIGAYLKALLGALKDGCAVHGYTYWSLMDNFEWMRGYSERFGLYRVDYTSARRAREPRLSASLFSGLARSHCIPELYNRLDDYLSTRDEVEHWANGVGRYSTHG